MFDNILGKKKNEGNDTSGLVERISKMNLSDMKVYLSNKLTDLPVSAEGIVEVLNRLNSKDANGNRFIEADAMDTKMKKAFELVILIGSSKLVTVSSVELATEFLTMYDDIIKRYDREHKDIYESRIKESIKNSIHNVGVMANVNNKMNALS